MTRIHTTCLCRYGWTPAFLFVTHTIGQSRKRNRPDQLLHTPTSSVALARWVRRKETTKKKKTMKRLRESDDTVSVSTTTVRPDTEDSIPSQQTTKERERENAIEADDLLSALPVELQHGIIVWSFRCHPASVGCLDATNVALHAAVRSARIKIDSWAHHSRMCVGVLPIARLACATGARNKRDAITDLAIAVMYAYVAGSVGEKECWHYRGLHPKGSLLLGCSGPFIERLGLPRPNSASPHALVEWIASNHHALNRRAGPPLFPVVVDWIKRDDDDYSAPATMGKYWTCGFLAPRGRDILRVGGPLDREGRVREAFCDTEKLDLLFGWNMCSVDALIDLPRRTTMHIAFPCVCHKKGTTCKTCCCLCAVTNALDRPETERRAIEWINKRTADHLPAAITSCIVDCPQLGLCFTDLFCVSDMHAVCCADTVLFFGVARPRSDVAAFMVSASRLRGA